MSHYENGSETSKYEGEKELNHGTVQAVNDAEFDDPNIEKDSALAGVLGERSFFVPIFIMISNVLPVQRTTPRTRKSDLPSPTPTTQISPSPLSAPGPSVGCNHNNSLRF